jgi:hypothetical protein
VFGHGPQTAFQDYNNAKAEGYYQSRKREPLAKSYSRNHVLPEQTKQKMFAFGLTTGASESSKNLLYPEVKEDEDVHAPQYIRSHGSYGPGQQRNREYKWDQSAVDPNVHRFGKVEKEMLKNGVQLCLDPKKDDGVAKTRITAKQVEDIKGMKDHLGRSRNLGHGNRGLGQAHVFGVKGTLDQWDAQMCIAGDYSAGEQAPDTDLGTSATPGWRNVAVEKRAFGCPTLRTDVPKPGARSISDNQNYGDDVNAQFLLYPPQFSTAGVEDEDFAEARSQADIREMFENIGYRLSEREFQQVWNDAATNYDLNSDGIVSVEEFRSALNKWMDNR